ncbi:MAG: hypothetical protein HY698_10320 [Deltaproteobacteria bacterium]|nr:hypothetical protein [Deltaproteobacteria bacterium]
MPAGLSWPSLPLDRGLAFFSSYQRREARKGERYQATLHALRQVAEDAVKILEEDLAELPPHFFKARWVVLHVASELEHPTALSLFRSAIWDDPAPVTIERGNSHDENSPLVMEDTTRLAAIRGIEGLAGMSSTGALDMLLEIAKAHPSYAIRSQAALAYLAKSPDEAAARRHLRAVLRPGDEDILAIQRVSEAPKVASHP